MHDLFQTLSHDMFRMPLPLAEKILRPVIVYLCLVVFLRIFGKRELAQLNPFDLVVLLSLSNTVQNAMIGDDNSVSGGVVGAFSLLAINWVLAWVLYRAPKATTVLLAGQAATLIREGVIDEAELKKQSLTHEDLISVLNKNGFNDPADVQECLLEPNGTFFVEGKNPSSDAVERQEMIRALEQLSREVKALRREIEAKG
jgi:uncharacterized membrane protein YcaP (DUF421 family)